MSGDTETAKNYLILQKRISDELNKLISCEILYEEEAMNIANDILFNLIALHKDCVCSITEVDTMIVQCITTTTGPYSGLDSKYSDLILDKLRMRTDSPLVESCYKCWNKTMESKERESIWLF